MSCSHAAASSRPASGPTDGREAAGPGGDALDVGPAAGKRVGQEGAGEVLSPGCERVHEIHASQQGWDVHGRGLASGDV